MMWLTFLLISLSGEILAHDAIPEKVQRTLPEANKAGKRLDADMQNLDIGFSNVDLRVHPGNSSDSCRDSDGCTKFNGHCMEKASAGQCDFLVDNCFPQKCTCCGYCHDDLSICKKRKGTCRSRCMESEYYAWKFPCTYDDHCRCCKDKCPKKCGSGGEGMCMHTSEKCPDGWYESTRGCDGGPGQYKEECKCCLPCFQSEECQEYEGFCEGREKACPIYHYDLYDLNYWDLCTEPMCKCRCCALILPPMPMPNSTAGVSECPMRDVAVNVVKAHDFAGEDEDFIEQYELDDN